MYNETIQPPETNGTMFWLGAELARGRVFRSRDCQGLSLSGAETSRIVELIMNEKKCYNLRTRALMLFDTLPDWYMFSFLEININERHFTGPLYVTRKLETYTTLLHQYLKK